MKLKLLSELKGHLCNLLLFAAAWLSLFIEWYVGGNVLGGYGPSLIGTIIKFLGDGLLILLPYWFLSRRWRWSIILPVWLLAAWWVMNIWYARFWGDILPSTAILMVSNVNGTLTNSVLGLWQVQDIIYIAVPVIFTFIYMIMRRRIADEPPFTRPFRTAVTVITILAFILSQTAYLYSQRKYIRQRFEPSAGWQRVIHDTYLNPTATAFQALKINGITIFAIRNTADTWNAIFVTRTLSDDETVRVKRYSYTVRELQRHDIATIPDSIVDACRNKNLILIVTESLNADVIGRTIDGHPVTPVLNSLIEKTGTISGLKMTAQVKDGSSSDGQMIYNTGLLPLDEGAASMLVGDKHNFQSLTKRLARPAAVVLGEDARSWNERTTFRNYGFNTIVATTDRDGLENRIGADAAMFRWGEQIIDSIPSPFFLEFITYSMHIPFDDPAVKKAPWIENAPGIDRNERNYLAMTNYFDCALGDFINYLKHKNLYNNTIIVIVSDHNQSLNTNPDDDTTYQPIVFIAVNTGMTLKIDRHFGQVDVYPTLLRLMGIDFTADGYYGLGRLITSPDLNGAVDGFGQLQGTALPDEEKRMTEAYSVSNLILRDKKRLK